MTAATARRHDTSADWTDEKRLLLILCLKRLTVLAALVVLTAGVTVGCLTSNKKDSTPTPTTSATAASPTTQATQQPDATGVSETPPASASPGTSSTPNGDLTGPSVAVSGIVETPEAYDGETVTTHGEVEEIIGSNAFTIVDDNQEMLVVGATDVVPDNMTKGEFVQISGAVHTFDTAAFEAELGIGLEDEQYSRFDGQPAMVLQSIQVGALAIDDLLGNLGAYDGRTINVIGQVSQVLNTQAVMLTDPSASGTILAVTPFAAISKDMGASSWVRIVGSVKTLDTGNLQDLGPEFSFLDNASYSQYNGQPVILGTSVEVIAPSTTATVGDILAQPEGAQSNDIVVSAPVLRRVTGQAFTIGADGRELLVLASTAEPSGITPNALVVVSGFAVTLDVSNPPQVNGQPLGIDLRDANLAPFLGLRVLVAQSIQVVEPGT
jgi:uncharacterized protein YdeI (BOF family)